MTKRPAPSVATDAEVQALLVRYRCPVPFHEVRTRFLGNIATPDMNASPIKTVESLLVGPFLAVHLGVVLGFFLSIPYGKFVHGFYRLVALTAYAMERHQKQAVVGARTASSSASLV